jgi:2-polyprenyl-3-methyl-5-hydroxy-6-metoxy-1,4-benzoquinol methylase
VSRTLASADISPHQRGWDHPGLVRALAGLAEGRTCVIGANADPVRSALRRRRNVTLVELPPAGVSGEDCEVHHTGTVETVLAVDALPVGDRSACEALIRQLGARVGESGRLVVCVPNADAAAGEAGLSRRELRRLMRPLGRPRIVSTQPFRWLIMSVQRTEPVSRSTSERYAVIAELCHGAVLELGCGPGELAALLAERGLRVLGVDKNEEKIRLAQERFPGVDFETADITEFVPPRRSYDCVILAEVLEHVPEDVGQLMLDAAWDRVGSGGRLIVSVPNEDCVPHRNHLREFDSRSLGRLLSGFGTPQLVIEQPYKYLLMFVERPEY